NSPGDQSDCPTRAKLPVEGRRRILRVPRAVDTHCTSRAAPRDAPREDVSHQHRSWKRALNREWPFLSAKKQMTGDICDQLRETLQENGASLN
ncbi:hypothetical protein P7K49_004413, partial [Saguinus oedipus]